MHKTYKFTRGKKRCNEVMEAMIGRKLAPKEIVHHIDSDTRNDKPSNLHLFHCQRCHMSYHNQPAVGLRYVIPHLHPVPEGMLAASQDR